MARLQLSKQARLHRKTLFDDGHLPSDEEKWRVYDEIVNVFGCSSYTRHQHSNWCTGRERSRHQLPRMLIAAKLHANPNPAALDVACWALEIGVSEVNAFRLVGELLSEAVKAQAAFEHSLNHSQVATLTP